jgi:hypothetical protein
MTKTDADIGFQVTQAIQASGPELAKGIDVDGIVGEIIQAHGLVDVETIPHDEFWAIVQRHDATQH